MTEHARDQAGPGVANGAGAIDERALADLPAATKHAAVRGGAVLVQGTIAPRLLPCAHGCPACPHPAGTLR